MITLIKQSFLQFTKVASSDQAIGSALIAALRRNPTYMDGISSTNKYTFRTALVTQIRGFADQYREDSTEQRHLGAIVQISDEMSQQYAHILKDNRLRIGTTQKALNLYMKFMWCLDSNWCTPPHCPIDRIVLKEAGINNNWTELDDIELYSEWIARLRTISQRTGATNLAEWELGLWNQKRQGVNAR
jgi:hypothetical protein